MNEIEAFMTHIGLPQSARVDRVVAKKLLVENGAPTPADRKAINTGIDKIQWLAALKPSGIGVPEYRDGTHHYIEIAIVAMMLRTDAKLVRLAQLLHRAIPYPVLLICSGSRQDFRPTGNPKLSASSATDGLHISVAEKRLSERQADKTVLEAGVTGAWLPADTEVPDAFSLASQPNLNLRALYQGWRSVIEAIQASAISGRFEMLREPEAAYIRRNAIERHNALVSEIAGLRALATKERQVAGRVELNLNIKQLQTELQQAKNKL